jgi:UDP-glucose 4-epimerase
MPADVNVACGLPWMALRYFNAAGADPDGQIGEARDPETHLIPLVLAAARSGIRLGTASSVNRRVLREVTTMARGYK